MCSMRMTYGWKIIMKFSFKFIQQNEVQLSIEEIVLHYNQEIAKKTV
jgi:hypothetical protein